MKILLEIFGLEELYSYLIIGGVALLLLILLIIIIASASKRKKKKKAVKNNKSVNVAIYAEKDSEEKEKVEESAPKKTTLPKTNEVKNNDPKISERQYNGKYIVFREGKEIFRYRLQASNGETIVTSEPYSSIKGCYAGIETLKKNILLDTFDVVEDKHGLFALRIITKLGRVLALSANYKTKTRISSLQESLLRFVNTEVIEVEEDSPATHYEAETFDSSVVPEEKGKFVITEDNGFTYSLKASNGRVICKSQSYGSKDSCKEALEKFRSNVYEGTFYISKDKNGKFQFKLYNKQKRLVISGEIYDDKARVISVIESIKRFAKLAEISKG